MKDFIEKLMKGKDKAEKLMIMASVSPAAVSVKKEMKEKERYAKMAMGCTAILFGGLAVINPAVAQSQTQTSLWNTIKPFINLVANIFQVIGFVMIVFASGQLIVAFKSDDPDSKVRASYTLLAGVGLVILPTILTGLGILNQSKLNDTVS